MIAGIVFIYKYLFLIFNINKHSRNLLPAQRVMLQTRGQRPADTCMSDNARPASTRILAMKARLVRALPLALAMLLLPPALAAAPTVLDRIIVVVNDGVVLQSELDSALEAARKTIAERKLTPPPDDVLRTQVLERLILAKLQTQRAASAGVRIDDRELNDVMTNIAQQNGMTLGQFGDMLRRQGVDFLSVREQVRDEVLINRVRQREVESRVSVTEQDIDLLLASQGANEGLEYRLSHILVAVPDGASDTERAKARAKAEGLLKRIRAGEDFAQIAIGSSDGQQALQGGDLDWRRAGDLPTLFASTAAKLKLDEVSDLLEVSSGFHILKLSGQRDSEGPKTVTETHARHILLMTNAVRNEDQARAQAQQVYERLQKDGDWDKLALEFSDDPGSKNSGGDLGFQPPGVFVPEFQIRLDQLKPGETAAPFRTQFGWHVASVIERRTRDTSVESRRARARAAIHQRKAAEEYDGWLRRLREEAYIEYRLKGDAEAARS